MVKKKTKKLKQIKKRTNKLKNLFTDIPPKVEETIFSFFRNEELLEASGTCKKWRKMCLSHLKHVKLSVRSPKERTLLRFMQFCNQNLTSLKSLDLKNQQRLTKEALKLVPKTVERVDLSNTNTTKEIFSALLSAVTKLTSLNLSNCKYITTACIALLPPTLIELDISRADLETNRDFEVAVLRHISKLNLKIFKMKNWKLEETDFQWIPSSVREFEFGPLEVSFNVLHSSLEKISITGFVIQEEIMNEFKNLKSLSLHKINAKDEEFQFLEKLPNLEEIHFDHSETLNGEFLKYITKKVKVLKIENILLKEFQHLSEFTNLESLTLNAVGDNTNIVSHIPKQLKKLTFMNLQYIDFHKCPTNLIELKFEKCLFEEKFDWLHKIDKLKKLEIEECRETLDIMDNDKVSLFSNLPTSLRYLSLKNSKDLIDDHIHEIPSFIQILDLSYTKITDAIFDDLPEDTIYLNIRHCKNISLNAIREFKKKQQITISCKGVNEKPIEKKSRKMKIAKKIISFRNKNWVV